MALSDSFWGADTSEPTGLPSAIAGMTVPEPLRDMGSPLFRVARQAFGNGGFNLSPDSTLIQIDVGIHRLTLMIESKKRREGFEWTGTWEVAWSDPRDLNFKGQGLRPELRKMDRQALPSINHAAGWLSSVHNKILNITIKGFREQLDPDHLLPNPSRAVTLVDTLSTLGLDDKGVIRAYGSPKMPWAQRLAGNRHYIRLLARPSGMRGPEKEQVGMIALGRKDRWRFGCTLHNEWARSVFGVDGFKANHESPTTRVPYAAVDTAKLAAQQLYVRSMHEWLSNLAATKPDLLHTP